MLSKVWPYRRICLFVDLHVESAMSEPQVTHEIEGSVFVKELCELVRGALNLGAHLVTRFRDATQQVLLLGGRPVRGDLDGTSLPLDRQTRQVNLIIWKSALHLVVICTAAHVARLLCRFDYPTVVGCRLWLGP